MSLKKAHQEGLNTIEYDCRTYKNMRDHIQAANEIVNESFLANSNDHAY